MTPVDADPTGARDKPAIGRAWSTAEFFEIALRHVQFDGVPRALLIDLLDQAGVILNFAIEADQGELCIALEAVLDKILSVREIIRQTIPPGPDRDDLARP
jgi:hypothetical protein